MSAFKYALLTTPVTCDVKVCASLKPPRAPTEPSSASVEAGGHAAASGAASSLRIVPAPWPSAIVLFGELLARLTLNVSFASSRTSFVSVTVIVRVLSPGAKVRVSFARAKSSPRPRAVCGATT